MVIREKGRAEELFALEPEDRVLNARFDGRGLWLGLRFEPDAAKPEMVRRVAFLAARPGPSAAADHLRHLLDNVARLHAALDQIVGDRRDGLLDAALQGHRVRARRDETQAVGDHRLGEHRGGGVALPHSVPPCWGCGFERLNR